MKERLIQLLDLEQLSPSKFADLIGVQRSSISHIISGRNKPSFDFLERTLKAFPGLNASWLMMGEGTMYEQMGRKVTGNLFDTPFDPEEPDEQIGSTEKAPGEQGISSNDIPGDRKAPEAVKAPEREVLKERPAISQDLNKAVSEGKRRIVQVMVIYDDDTFRTFAPAN